jgi:serine/threonine protein kinase/formylglycine-generating enzyme required for sulfatase activity
LSDPPSRYDVGSSFAKGGVGAIHSARDEALSREVAYKVLLPHRSDDRQHRVRFVREARLTAQLQHPNIVPVHDLGVDSQDRLFFTMKRIRGRSLARVLKSVRADDVEAVREFTLPRLLTAFGKVCQAVHYAHTRGVLHRDLKPDNVMIGAFGEVLVMDWGLAKRIEAVSGSWPTEGEEMEEAALRLLADDDTGRLAALWDQGLPEDAELLEPTRDLAIEGPSGPSEVSVPPSGRLDQLDSDWDSAAPSEERPDLLGAVGESAGSFETLDGRVMGTPTHMSPEQARAQELDRRSDVFSLGVILYEILTLRPPFFGRTAMQVMIQVAKGEFVPPRRRAPDRAVDEAIEAICLKAMSVARADRYDSAWELFEDVEAFLQGRLERQRRQQAADEAVEAAERAGQRWRSAAKRLRQLGAEATRLAGGVQAWDPLETRRSLWRIEDEHDAVRLEQLRHFTEMVQLLQEALRLDPDCEPARLRLAETWWRKLQEAEASSDLEGQIRYEANLRAIDDGTWGTILEAPGNLRVESEPSGARTFLLSLVERDRRLERDECLEVGSTPCDLRDLPSGRYLLELEAHGRRTAQVPVRIHRGQEASIEVRLFTPDEVGEEFVHIPAGPVTVGGDPSAPRSLEPVECDLPDFAMSVFPVTMEGYLGFLNDLVDAGRGDEAWRRAPRREPSAGQYLIRLEDGHLDLPAEDGDGHRWDPQLPVMSISFDDAVACAQWRSQRDGVRYRLPTDAEWEKAARGPDGRIYPWGDRWDPALCLTHAAQPEVQPRPVGWAEGDVSPYGVRDLAGGSRDWVDGWKSRLREMRAQRGGAWWDKPEHSRLAYRTGWRADNVYGDSGVRLVKSLPLEPAGPALVDEDDPRRGGLTDEHLPSR